MSKLSIEKLEQDESTERTFSILLPHKLAQDDSTERTFSILRLVFAKMFF